MHNSDLVTDRPGHYQSDGTAHGAYAPHSTPHEVEVDQFARELATQLHHVCNNGNYSKLVLIAPSRFHGYLKKHYSDQVRSHILYSIEKDYTKTPLKELQAHLAEFVKIK